MLFGNWNVTDNGITWDEGGTNRFEIPKNDLNKTRRADSGDGTYYDWILKATEEDWLSQNDLYDLNFAFVYAIAKAGLDFDYDIFDATMAEQFDQFDMEEDEE